MVRQDRRRAGPSARRRAAAALAAQDALDLLVSWVRDLWVVASGASDVLWNSDHRDALVAAVVATPEHYARLLGVSRQDPQRPVSQHRPEARAAGDVRALRGGLRQCLGSAASCSAAAAGSTSSAPATSSWRPATASWSTPPAARTSDGSSRAADEVAADDAPRGLRRVLRKATPADLEADRLAPRDGVLEAKRECRAPRRRAQARHQGRRGPPGVRRPQAHHHLLRRGAHRRPRAPEPARRPRSAAASSSSR